MVNCWADIHICVHGYVSRYTISYFAAGYVWYVYPENYHNSSKCWCPFYIHAVYLYISAYIFTFTHVPSVGYVRFNSGTFFFIAASSKCNYTDTNKRVYVYVCRYEERPTDPTRPLPPSLRSWSSFLSWVRRDCSLQSFFTDAHMHTYTQCLCTLNHISLNYILICVRMYVLRGITAHPRTQQPPATSHSQRQCHRWATCARSFCCWSSAIHPSNK